MWEAEHSSDELGYLVDEISRQSGEGAASSYCLEQNIRGEANWDKNDLNQTEPEFLKILTFPYGETKKLQPRVEMNAVAEKPIPN